MNWEEYREGLSLSTNQEGINRPLNSKEDEVRTPGKILYRDHAMKSPVNTAADDLNKKPVSLHDAKKNSNKKIAFTSMGLMSLFAEEPKT